MKSPVWFTRGVRSSSAPSVAAMGALHMSSISDRLRAFAGVDIEAHGIHENRRALRSAAVDVRVQRSGFAGRGRDRRTSSPGWNEVRRTRPSPSTARIAAVTVVPVLPYRSGSSLSAQVEGHVERRLAARVTS